MGIGQALDDISAQVNPDGLNPDPRVASIIVPLRQLLLGMRHHVRHADIKCRTPFARDERNEDLKIIDNINVDLNPNAYDRGYSKKETGVVEQFLLPTNLGTTNFPRSIEVQQKCITIRPFPRSKTETFLEVKSDDEVHQTSVVPRFPPCPPVHETGTKLEHVFDQYISKRDTRSVYYLVCEAATLATRQSFGLQSIEPLSCGLLKTRIRSRCPGINTPYAYFGQASSVTALHIEDAFLYSKNFCHAGWKLWLVVRPESLPSLESHLKQVFKPRLASGSDFVRDLCVFLAPQQLREWEVSFEVFLQGPGDLIVTYPKAYHQVLNLTDSVAEAINFAPENWELDEDYSFRTDQTARTNGSALTRAHFFTSPSTEETLESNNQKTTNRSRSSVVATTKRRSAQSVMVADGDLQRKRPRVSKESATPIAIFKNNVPDDPESSSESTTGTDSDDAAEEETTSISRPWTSSNRTDAARGTGVPAPNRRSSTSDASSDSSESALLDDGESGKAAEISARATPNTSDPDDVQVANTLLKLHGTATKDYTRTRDHISEIESPSHVNPQDEADASEYAVSVVVPMQARGAARGSDARPTPSPNNEQLASIELQKRAEHVITDEFTEEADDNADDNENEKSGEEEDPPSQNQLEKHMPCLRKRIEATSGSPNTIDQVISAGRGRGMASTICIQIIQFAGALATTKNMLHLRDTLNLSADLQGKDSNCSREHAIARRLYKYTHRNLRAQCDIIELYRVLNDDIKKLSQALRTKRSKKATKASGVDPSIMDKYPPSQHTPNGEVATAKNRVFRKFVEGLFTDSQAKDRLLWIKNIFGRGQVLDAFEDALGIKYGILLFPLWKSDEVTGFNFEKFVFSHQQSLTTK